nr:hypothetical protein [Paraburkholderia lacunae]
MASAEELADCVVVLSKNYLAPIVDHAQARQHTLARFGT